MHSPRKIQNIALIGFMGTGKTSVGRLVADLLRFGFLDTDELIEKRVGKSINRLFEEDGEAAFREQERRVIEQLVSETRMVISTGGGVGANPADLDNLKGHALVVCLWASPQTIWNRVRSQGHRPLLQTENPEAKIRELLAVREPFYRQADILLNTEVRSAKEVAQHVAHEFHFAVRSR
ncbi:MAG: shikimate kinase [Verrucomicrobiota bacterium]